MTTSNFLKNQQENKNFLSPVGFKFSLTRAKKVDFFSNTANIPSLDLGVATQPTYLRDTPIPGDKISFGDFDLEFIVDEDFENYLEIHNWIRGLGYPKDVGEYQRLTSKRQEEFTTRSTKELNNMYSDGSLFILNSNFQPNMEIRFSQLFPYTLSTLQFNAKDTDYDYFTARVSFKYTIFDMYDMRGNLLS